MQRIFELKENVLYMRTHLEDEFGSFVLLTAAGISPVGSIIIQEAEGEAFDSSIPMDVKIREMSHFLSILKLFDPNPLSNFYQDGISQNISQTPPESWEKE